MKRIKSKKYGLWLTTFLATAFTLFGAGVATIDSVGVSAENAVTAENVGLVMDKGAGVRLGTLDGNNGIRFVLTMDKTEYNALMEKVGTDEGDTYSDISFGMIITKAEYVSDSKELSVENLFDANKAVFEWKPEGAGDDWMVSEGKTLVVNQTFGYLGTAEDYENDYVGFASLVELRDYNLTQEFVGRGYMRYTTADGTVNYRMADYYEDVRANNVRSMTYVAQKAVEDPEMSGYVDTLNSLYITHSAVQAETVNVTINHHKVDVHGNEIVEIETLTEQKIGATATATALTDEEWIYDETKSTASGVVYANDKTVLDLYYDQNPETVYDLWFVGGVDPQDKTFNLNEPVTGGVYGDTVKVTLKFDLLEGTMPKINFCVNGSTDGVTQLTQTKSSYFDISDYANDDGTYTFTADFAWKNGNWDIHSLKVFVSSGSNELGVDVVAVEIVPVEYDLKWLAAYDPQTYTLETPVTGAALNDTVVIEATFTTLYGSLNANSTDVNIQLYNGANASGDKLNETWIELSEWLVEGTTNKYRIELKLTSSVADLTVASIVMQGRLASKCGINIESVSLLEYDVKITGAYTYQVYNLETPVTGAVQNDTLAIVATIDTLSGDLNHSTNTDLYFALFGGADATGINVMNKWVELSDCLVEGTTNQYRIEMALTWGVTDFTVSSIQFNLRVNASCGINIVSMTVVSAA